MQHTEKSSFLIRSKSKSKKSVNDTTDEAQERFSIMKKVMAGELPETCLTMTDVVNLQSMVMDAVITRLAQENDMTFSSMEKSVLH